ncbi:MAG: hypothetical protein U0821_21640 [Chloroflexota bacterium]
MGIIAAQADPFSEPRFPILVNGTRRDLAVCIQATKDVNVDTALVADLARRALATFERSPQWLNAEMKGIPTRVAVGCPSVALLLAPGVTAERLPANRDRGGYAVISNLPTALVSAPQEYLLNIFIISNAQFRLLFGDGNVADTKQVQELVCRRVGYFDKNHYVHGDCKFATWAMFMAASDATSSDSIALALSVGLNLHAAATPTALPPRPGFSPASRYPPPEGTPAPISTAKPGEPNLSSIQATTSVLPTASSPTPLAPAPARR